MCSEGSPRGAVRDLSAREPAAVDDGEHRTGDVRRRRRGEIDDGALEIAGRSPARDGDERQDVAAALRVIAQCLGVVGLHVARRDGVDVDAEPASSFVIARVNVRSTSYGSSCRARLAAGPNGPRGARRTTTKIPRSRSEKRPTERS
jgi:hypothetical protein